MMLPQLIKKYDVPVPRYTSYPTVPYWDQEHFSERGWWKAVERSFDETNNAKGISLYVHLPFCESLCTYCACNTRITKNHRVEEKYIEAVLQEWAGYKKKFSSTPIIRELHLGGGTPTFFSAENLRVLIEGLLSGCKLHPQHEFSFEGHPNNTTTVHLQTLFELGFRRVSFGVQDLNEKVQVAIHRIQPFENLKRVTEESRAIGYTSVSYDLIYGLPYQTMETVTDTIKQVRKLRPDRLAFYSYAHVPWIKSGQRGYEDADLPTDVVKRSLYETGRALFLEEGYQDVGMDHFALPSDALFKAQQEGRLHRNFMGYTTNQTDLLIGLGTSSISDAKYAYRQNVKSVEEYEERIHKGESICLKGHLHTDEDLVVKNIILDIACRGRVDNATLLRVWDNRIAEGLSALREDGLVIINESAMVVSMTGRAFIRNVCSIFDLRLQEQRTTAKFSRAI